MDRDTEEDRRLVAGRTRAPYEVAAVSTRSVPVRRAWDAAGFYPVFATLDDALVQQLIATAGANGWDHRSTSSRCSTACARLGNGSCGRGLSVRVFLPFGSDWWPYSIRRVGEHPRNILVLGRALLGRSYQPTDELARRPRWR